MGRFDTPYEEDNGLPYGMVCIGYDADEGRKYYSDKNGSTWVGSPYVDKGILRPYKSAPARKNTATVRRKTDSYIGTHDEEPAHDTWSIISSVAAEYPPDDYPSLPLYPQHSAQTNTQNVIDRMRTIKPRLKELSKRYLDGLDRPGAIASQRMLQRNMTSPPSLPPHDGDDHQSPASAATQTGRGANSSGQYVSQTEYLDANASTWPPASWDAYISATIGRSETSLAQYPQGPSLEEFAFNYDTLTFTQLSTIDGKPSRTPSHSAVTADTEGKASKMPETAPRRQSHEFPSFKRVGDVVRTLTSANLLMKRRR